MKDIKSAIKYGIEWGMNAGTLGSMDKDAGRRIVLLLSPQYLNYGDHAIALSELWNLRRLFPQTPLLDINYSLFALWPQRVKEAIKPGDIIVVTGGGYMGNLWPDNHALAEKIIDLFPENRIVFAPQTLFYKDTPEARQEKERLARKLRRHGNFFFFARDARSGEQMERLGFTRGKEYDLMPDFVLLMPPVMELKPRGGNGAMCLRSDDEALGDLREKAEATLGASFPGKVDSIKMARDHVEIPLALRERLVRNKLRQFADAGAVVTDRLHGMVFAAYAGTPCVAFDNISGKVSGVHQWIRELDYIAVADDISQLPELLDRVKDKQKEENRKAFFARQEALAKEYLPKFAFRLK